MKNKFLQNPICLFLLMFCLSGYTFASDHLSGIWSGTVNFRLGETNVNYEEPIYLSIHQTPSSIAVIFLSAAEATQDLMSSTYLGATADKLTSLGEKAYFPNFNPSTQSLSYIDTRFPLILEFDTENQSGLIHIVCETCNSTSAVFIHKVM